MKKWIVAALMTLTAICASTGARSAALAATPQEPVAYGSCRWYCSTTGASYTSASTCQTSCAGFCDEVC